MKQLTIIIICAMICISASVVSKNVFIPARPTKFFIKEYNGGSIDGIKDAKQLHLNGWQNIKILLSTNHVMYPNVIVTAEKY